MDPEESQEFNVTEVTESELEKVLEGYEKQVLTTTDNHGPLYKAIDEKIGLFAKNTNDLVFVTTFALRPKYVYVSPSLFDHSGYKAKEFLGKECFDFVHPEDLPKLKQLVKDEVIVQFRNLITGRRVHRDIAYRTKHKDGSWNHSETTVNAFIIHKRPLLLYHAKNVTERKKQEKESKEQEKELEKLKKAETRREAYSSLAGFFAHTSNNKLHTALGNFQMMQDYLKDEHPDVLEKIQSYIDPMEYSLQAVAELGKKLVNYSTKKDYFFAPIDINKPVDFVINKAGKGDAGHINRKIKSEANIWQIKGDDLALIEVIKGLYNNAKTAVSNNDYKEISIETKNVIIPKEKGYLKSGKYVRFSMIDNGIGMDAKTLDNIFQPGYSTQDPNVIAGMGLALIDRIIDDHDGTITVESKPGKGSRFDIYLPVFDIPFKTDKRSYSSEVIKGNQEKVLIVDDETETIKIWDEYLTNFNYNVKTTDNGEDAIKIFKENDFDVVLLDYVLGPDSKNGDEICRNMLNINPDAKIISISGGGFNNFKANDQIYSASMKKPFPPNKLTQLIHEVLYNK